MTGNTSIAEATDTRILLGEGAGTTQATPPPKRLQCPNWDEYAAAYLQGLAALLLAFIPDFSIAMVGAAMLGLGYGCYMAVDQALATQVLPSSHTRGKDLGIMNIATAVPQAVAPLLGSFIVAALGGFTGLFIASAVAAALGGLAVIPIKSVK